MSTVRARVVSIAVCAAVVALPFAPVAVADTTPSQTAARTAGIAERAAADVAVSTSEPIRLPRTQKTGGEMRAETGAPATDARDEHATEIGPVFDQHSVLALIGRDLLPWLSIALSLLVSVLVLSYRAGRSVTVRDGNR